jgi:hypothetical protein
MRFKAFMENVPKYIHAAGFSPQIHGGMPRPGNGLFPKPVVLGMPPLQADREIQSWKLNVYKTFQHYVDSQLISQVNGKFYIPAEKITEIDPNALKEILFFDGIVKGQPVQVELPDLKTHQPRVMNAYEIDVQKIRAKLAQGLGHDTLSKGWDTVKQSMVTPQYRANPNTSQGFNTY